MGTLVGNSTRAISSLSCMNISWSPLAIGDLEHLRSYIAETDPTAAQRVALHILRHIETVLVEYPHSGRSGRVAGTREAVIPKTRFVVPYRTHGQTLEILRIYNAAQRWPDIF